MADNQIRGIEGQDCPAIRVTQGAGCPAIRVKLTGGGGTKAVDPLDVNFYDYDGTCVAAYTAADFAALDAMPGNPSHQGLTAQGWNWSLADAQAYVAANGKLNIGQNYITDDGKTRLYINIAEPGRMTVPVNFSQTAANGVTVDWGDGSATETAAGTGNKTITHTYAAPGYYRISLTVTSGTAALGGTNNVPAVGANSNAARVYSSMLYRVEVGDMLLNNSNTFSNCYGLENITIPDTITNMGSNFFNACIALRFVVFPKTPQFAGGSCLSGCASLRGVCFPKNITINGNPNYFMNSSPAVSSLTLPVISSIPLGFASAGAYTRLQILIIPEGVAELKDSVFGNNVASLSSVTLPSTLATIGANAFQNCYGLAELHCKATTPPTIAANSFANLPADAKIYVPAASLATYQGASGWSSYASQMIGE